MNQLKVSTQQSITALFERGWSQRRIVRELRLDRSMVARYARLPIKLPSNPTHRAGANPATNPLDSDPPGPTNLCAPVAEQFTAAVQAVLSAQRIYKDLVRDHGIGGAKT